MQYSVNKGFVQKLRTAELLVWEISLLLMFNLVSTINVLRWLRRGPSNFAVFRNNYILI